MPQMINDHRLRRGVYDTQLTSPDYCGHAFGYSFDCTVRGVVKESYEYDRSAVGSGAVSHVPDGKKELRHRRPRKLGDMREGPERTQARYRCLSNERFLSPG